MHELSVAASAHGRLRGVGWREKVGLVGVRMWRELAALRWRGISSARACMRVCASVVTCSTPPPMPLSVPGGPSVCWRGLPLCRSGWRYYITLAKYK